VCRSLQDAKLGINGFFASSEQGAAVFGSAEKYVEIRLIVVGILAEL